MSCDRQHILAQPRRRQTSITERASAASAAAAAAAYDVNEKLSAAASMKIAVIEH